MKNALTLFITLLLISCGGGKKNNTTTVITDTGTPTTTTSSDTSTVGTTTTASVIISASPSASAAVGASIMLFATVTGISDPVYDYQYVSGDTTNVTASQNGDIASISSSVNKTIIIGVIAKSKSNSSIQVSNQITLQFGTGSSTTTTPTSPTTSTGSINCWLTHTSSNPRVYGNFNFFITTNTGEQLRLVSWNPGESWHTPVPSMPYTLAMSGTSNYFYGYYISQGVKQVQVVAESVSRPGVFCNGGAVLTDIVVVGN